MAQVTTSNVKIVVTGGHGAGKTTFIQTISEPWEPHMGPSLVMDFGQVTVDETLKVYFFGTPRAQQFDFMQNIMDQLLCIVLVDSAHPETFKEAQSVIAAIEYSSEMPYVVAANFQDLDTAWHEDDLRIVLNIRPGVPIVPCAAWHVDSVRNVVLTLLEMVLYNMDADV